MVQRAFRLLGPLEATVDGQPVRLTGRRERALLGVLLLNAGTVVSIEQLIDGVWGDPAPRSARHMVHEYVLRVRAALGDATLISTRAPGYTVSPADGELDARKFEVLVQAARRAREATSSEDALRTFDHALGLWRGDALCDVALEGNARAAADSLDDLRRTVAAERVDVALALGRHHELIPGLERALAADPLDERARGQLMLALYRDGRQSEALERYRAGRRRLVEEVGVEPGSDLRALEQSILRQDSSLALETPAVGREPSAAQEPGDARSSPSARSRSRIAAAAVAVAAATVGVIVAIAATRGADAVAPVRGDAVAIVDAAHARLLGSIPIGSRPGAIAFGSRSVWVSALDSSSLSRISPSSRRVIATVSLPHAAQSLTVAGGRLWAAIGAAPADTSLTVVRINPTFDSVSRVKRVPIVAAGDSASLAARGDSVAVAPRSGLLTWIDARDGRTLERTDINAAPNAIAVGFGSTWLAYREANVLLRLEPDGTTTRIPVGRGPSAVAVGEHAVWVADALDDTVKPIDPATNSPITTVRVGSAPSAIAIGGGGVWVANGGDGTLTRIDPRRDRVTATVKIGGSPQALVVVDGKVWVSVQAPPPAQPSGGRAVVSVPRFIDEFDPAVSGTFDAAQILYAACAMLLNYPDEPGAAGLRLIPEAARALPTVSADGRTYTFVIRPGMRFSPPSNQPVTAKTFKYTIERSLSPRRAKDGYGQDLLGDVVGAKAYFAKHARHITGVQAQGDRLTVRLTQPAPDLPTRLAQMPFCAVPTDMPLTPARGAIPSAGPYYIASQTPKRGLVLLRNPNYHGDRPRRLDRIDVIIGAPNRPVAEAEAGRVDYPLDGVPAAQDARLRRLYGAGSVAARHGKQRYFVHRKPQVDTVDLNTRRPLFASRRMRRAVNYAVDRRALAASGGTYFAAAEPADMYLPPGVPGFRETHPYPLVPDLAAARRLAGSAHHTAVLYCLRQGGGVRAARIIAHDLAAIRIDVRVRCMPGDEFWFRILLHPDEPWDMVVDGSGISNDPADFLDSLGQDTGNVGHFHDPRYTRMLRAAKRLSGARRAAAYARIDDELVRDAAPSIAFANENAHDFFSARMGCQVYQPVVGIDLAALCIRPNG